MTGPDDPPVGPPRRRAPWSFKHLVEDVSGRPLADFQEPNARPPGTTPAPPRRAPGSYTSASTVAIPAAVADPVAEEEVDPVARIYPPLSGSTARALHGAEAEHHGPTLESVNGPGETWGPGNRHHAPGPSKRPERIDLHYLLLHLDRLNDAGLRYLQHAVDEEILHREEAPPVTPTSPPVAEIAAPAAPGPEAVAELPITEAPPEPASEPVLPLESTPAPPPDTPPPNEPISASPPSP